MIQKQLSTLSLALIKLRTHAVIKIYGYEQRIFDWYSGTSTAGLTHTQVDTYNADTENWPHLGCQWPALSFLLIAGMLAYQRVVGVEIDSELAMEARRNVENFRHRKRAGVIESVTASVVGWKVPDDSSIVFMQNPFFGETFKEAMANVFSSYDRNPREMHIVYMFPWEHEWLLSTGRVHVESVRSEGWPKLPQWWASEHVTVIYHITEENQSPTRCRSVQRRPSAAGRKALQRWRTPSKHFFQVHT
jgi:predicted RNA methylase